MLNSLVSCRWSRNAKIAGSNRHFELPCEPLFERLTSNVRVDCTSVPLDGGQKNDQKNTQMSVSHHIYAVWDIRFICNTCSVQSNAYALTHHVLLPLINDDFFPRCIYQHHSTITKDGNPIERFQCIQWWYRYACMILKT